MKKIGLISALFLGIASFVAIGLGTRQAYTHVLADPEETETEEIFECSVVVEEATHGKVRVSKTEGHVGDLVEVNADSEMFYLVQSCTVNGTALVESEETTGLFTFALVEGVNVITVKFAIDQELLGQFSEMVEQASNKDWTNLFSVKNVITIVTFLLNGGLLITMVRYFIKDKKIAKNVEKSVKESMDKIVPETTKNAVINTVQEVVTPIFAQILAHQEELEKAMAIFAKCMALSQEDTPEARRAILDELSGLKIGDMNIIEAAKEYIENLIKNHKQEMEDMLTKINEIIDSNKSITGTEGEEEAPETSEEPEPVELVEEDNGTQI